MSGKRQAGLHDTPGRFVLYLMPTMLFNMYLYQTSPVC
jgi:hypothetical protein